MNTPNDKPADGGSAFPQSTHAYLSADKKEWHQQSQTGGMTLRDYFAAKAMQSLALDYSNTGEGTYKLAEVSYIIADAMLAEREKQTAK